MTNPSLAPAPVQRLLSMDVLRGLTIAFMIMVNNNGGSGSWGFMNHSPWNGITPTDLVFPSFVFVVGASIVFAFEARLARGATRAQLARHTLQRAAILFLLGFVIHFIPNLAREAGDPDNYIRFCGVLQRIALCYLIVGLFYLWDKRVWTKVAALAAALASYWILLRWIPVPGAGMPGRDIPFMDQSQNLASWLDRLLMPHHLYLGHLDHNLREPEGLLSTLPAVGTTLLGLLTGLWLRARQPVAAKALGLAAGSAACLASGYLWSIWFPLNKNLWTSSYVLVAAGWTLALFSLVFWACDVRGWRKGWTFPWLVLGSNAIVAYAFSELAPWALSIIRFTYGGRRTDVLDWIFDHVYARIPNPGWAAFAFSVSILAFCFIPVWVLYRKKIFVKV
jgi:predicted acyltransferase